MELPNVKIEGDVTLGTAVRDLVYLRSPVEVGCMLGSAGIRGCIGV
jgi:hypothetical protein